MPELPPEEPALHIGPVQTKTAFLPIQLPANALEKAQEKAVEVLYPCQRLRNMYRQAEIEINIHFHVLVVLTGTVG